MRFVKFPDCTEVRAASLADRRVDDSWRQFGLYLDEEWRPSWPSSLVSWQDFGLPNSCAQAADLILKVFRQAKAGQHIEVGCKGGLGRTGTVLACMAVLAGVAPEDAVRWVRENYDPEAIETPEQEKWVLWFGDQMKRRGDPTGEKP